MSSEEDWINEAIAILVVETWFRPFSIRILEYLKLIVDKRTTTGMCQANFDKYWKILLSPNITWSRRIIKMEDPDFNIIMAKIILKGSLSKDSTLIEVVEFYNGKKNPHYLELMCLSLQMIATQKLRMKVGSNY